MTQPRVTFHCLIDEKEIPTAIETWVRAFSERQAPGPRDGDGGDEAEIEVILTGRPPQGEETSSAARRVVWIDDRCGYDKAWSDLVRAWDPWRALVSRLSDERCESIPSDLRDILVWMPPFVPQVPVGETANPRKGVAVLVDGSETRQVRLAPSRQDAGPAWSLDLDELAHHAGESLCLEKLDARAVLFDPAQRARFARVALVASAIRDPMTAHAVRRLAGHFEIPYLNLLCLAASPLRGLGPALIGVEGVAGIREILAPFMAVVNGVGAARPDPAPDSLVSWIEFLRAEGAPGASSEPAWAAIHRLLRAEIPGGGRPGLRLALGLRMARLDAKLADVVASLSPDDHPEGWVRDFLREGQSLAWLEQFVDLWRRAPDWLELCRRAIDLTAGRRGALDPRGLAAWGVFQGVCGGFASDWRRKLVETAVEWWAADRRESRMSDSMRREEITALAALGDIDAVDALLAAAGPNAAGLRTRAANALLRESMPAVEDGTLAERDRRAFDAVRRWVDGESQRVGSGADAGLAGVAILLEIYTRRFDRAFELLGVRGGDAWLPTAALYLWLLGEEDLAGRCVAMIADCGAEIPASRLLPLATVHALLGDPMLAVRYLREAHAALPAMMKRVGQVNLRWHCLALTLATLGGGTEAELWRERARFWHPQGEARDRHFARVRVRLSGLDLPRFVVEAEGT